MRRWTLASTVIAVLMMMGMASAAGGPKDSLTIGLSSDASFINALIASDGQSYRRSF